MIAITGFMIAITQRPNVIVIQGCAGSGDKQVSRQLVHVIPGEQFHDLAYRWSLSITKGTEPGTTH